MFYHNQVRLRVFGGSGGFRLNRSPTESVLSKSSWQDDCNPKTDPANHARLGLAANAFLMALAFTLLVLVLRQSSDKISEVFRRRLDLRLLGLGLLIYQISLLITYVRWYMLVRVIEPKFRFRATILLGFISNLFSLVIPGPAGGDFIKAAYLARMHVKRTQVIASMLIDRILGLVGLFALGWRGWKRWRWASG